MYFRIMSEHILKRDNKTLLLYHLVFPLKYQKAVITKEIGEGLKDIYYKLKKHVVHYLRKTTFEIIN